MPDVLSSNGTFECDDTGRVTKFSPLSTGEPDYNRIIRLDLPSGDGPFDILQCGVHADDGRYDPPEWDSQKGT